MNDLFEIVEDLEALDAKVESLQALIDKWSAKVDAAEADMEQLYEMDDGA
jgi:peptidoglycan hydrolase CwlO-like protein